mgnify:CR=1 FL=1
MKPLQISQLKSIYDMLSLKGKTAFVTGGAGGIGRSCAAALAEAGADVVLMDIRMPVMDGLESARRIRTSGHPDARTIPIIALTANAFDEDTKKSLASGMNGHLSKPIQVDQMLEVMGRCMGLIS